MSSQFYIVQVYGGNLIRRIMYCDSEKKHLSVHYDLLTTESPQGMGK